MSADSVADVMLLPMDGPPTMGLSLQIADLDSVPPARPAPRRTSKPSSDPSSEASSDPWSELSTEASTEPSTPQPDAPATIGIPLRAARTVRHGGWTGRERRSVDPIHRLTREFDSLITAAVDHVEIVAGLEANGFTDPTAVEYRCQDLFDLAARMFAMTPRLADRQPGKLANPWSERPLRHLMRGLSFALPGLIFVAALPRSGGTAGLLALTAALMIGWPLSQILAYLGYTLAGQRHPMAARALLLAGLGVGLVLAGLFWVVTTSLGLSPGLAGVGAAEIAYLAAAAVIAVVGGDVVALAVLTPGLLTIGLTLLDHQAARWLPWGAGSAVGAAMVAAVVLCREARLSHLRTARSALGVHEWRETVAHACYGFAGAALVTLPALSGRASSATALSLLPLTWSMGVAEWSVVRVRRGAFEMLNAAVSVPEFAARSARQVTAAAGRYLVSLVLLTALAAAVLRHGSLGATTPETWWGLAAGVVLGLAFFVALVLSSLGQIRAVVPVLGLSALLGAAALLLPVAWAVMIAPLSAALLLLPVLRDSIGDPVRHM